MTVDIVDPFNGSSLRVGGELIKPGARVAIRSSFGTVQSNGSFTWDSGAFPATPRPTPPEGWTP